jgi:hypothetical protein
VPVGLSSSCRFSCIEAILSPVAPEFAIMHNPVLNIAFPADAANAAVIDPGAAPSRLDAEVRKAAGIRCAVSGGGIRRR